MTQKLKQMLWVPRSDTQTLEAIIAFVSAVKGV